MAEESLPASENLWPERARQHLEDIQKAAYTELAMLSGLRTPEEAYEAFTIGRIPPELFDKFVNNSKARFRPRILLNRAKRLFGYGEQFDMPERAREWFFSAQRPTPYENPLYYPLLLTLLSNMREGAKSNGFGQVIPPLLFGTLPTGRINALAVSVPDSDYPLVLFDFGLFRFTGEMAKILATLIPVQLRSVPFEMRLDMGKALDPQYAVDQRPELIAHFTEVLYKYLVEGNPRRMPAVDVSGTDQRFLSGYFMAASRTFILGHEMGHVLEGHVTGKKETRALIGGFSAPEIVRSWDDQDVADQWGLNYEQCQRANPEWALVGSSLFFCCWIAYERCLVALTSGRTDLESLGSDTHPPATERRNRLRAFCQKNYDPGYIGEGLEWSSYIEALMDAFMTRISPAFQQMHASGLRPFGRRTSA